MGFFSYFFFFSFFFFLPTPGRTLGREGKEGVKITLRWGWFHSQPWKPVCAGQRDVCGQRAGKWAPATRQQRPKLDEFRAYLKAGEVGPGGWPCTMCIAHTRRPPLPTLGFERGGALQALTGPKPIAQQQTPILDLGTPCFLSFK